MSASTVAPGAAGLRGGVIGALASLAAVLAAGAMVAALAPWYPALPAVMVANLCTAVMAVMNVARMCSVSGLRRHIAEMSVTLEGGKDFVDDSGVGRFGTVFGGKGDDTVDCCPIFFNWFGRVVAIL
jgi:hypothetical protein